MRAPALPAPGLPRPLQRAARLARAAATRAANEVNAPRFARQAERRSMLPNRAVVVFFATGPENLYQLEQWRLPLEELAGQRPVVVVVDRADTGEAVLRRTRLPVALARGSAALETLVAERDVRVVLYLNQVEANFRMLRFAAPVHVQLGHGESDKASSVSNQHKAYDLTFVGGPAGSERLAAALRGFDPATRTAQVGRPQLDHAYPGAPDWPADGRRRVLYAPTWEGDRPSIAYGSLASHGVPLVEALLAAGDVRLLYRPHPRTGVASAAHAAADRRIRELLARAGEDHLLDTGSYGWQWTFADACVTDVSAVAYDWLATGKPLVVTEPARSALRPPSALLDRLPLLGAADAGRVLERLHGQDPHVLADLTRHYFGDTAGRASTARFHAAVEACYASPLGAG
ncbi:MAG: Integral membrane protein [uncultured Friedmanniella sp.]|uniref:Integral membrane protein n=1 Tax=uncultured Friedmanniella sp. TaxID=335381 RepID=A0A6J4LAM5_9ACTN|nr:MAG: Integral membrane protein [uncultured Friedmanniella sp.]